MIIKEWKNEENYNFPDDFPLKRWAWEFLRRNEIYQECWRDSLEKQPENSGARWKDPNAGDFVIEDPRSQKFGLATGMLNPHNDSPIFLEFASTPSVQIVTGTGMETLGPLPNYSVAAIFDIQKPITPQLEKVEKRLHFMQEQGSSIYEEGFGDGDFVPTPVKLPSQPREMKTYWKDYVRVLDAKAAGIKTSQIAEIVAPHLRNKYPDYTGTNYVSRTYRTARELSNGGYLKFLV